MIKGAYSVKEVASKLKVHPNTIYKFIKSGEFDLNFSRYGEIIGKTGNSEIDEIEKEEKVVSLNVRYEQLPNGSYKVYGSLV